MNEHGPDWMATVPRTAMIVVVGSMRRRAVELADRTETTTIGSAVGFFCIYIVSSVVFTLVVLVDGNNGCQNSQRLYCLETAPYTPPALPSSDGCHVMFVTRFTSRARFNNDNNLTDRLGAIDAICNQEAAMLGTPLVKSRTSVGYVAWLSATVSGQQVFIWRGFCFVGCDDCFSF
jgi:hypothetical protein